MCKVPLPIEAMRGRGLPLPAADVTVLEQGLAWEDIVVRGAKGRGMEGQCGRVGAAEAAGRNLSALCVECVPVVCA